MVEDHLRAFRVPVMSAKRYVKIAAASTALAISGCATIVNDSMIPLAFTFSDGSAGSCEFTNKRGSWTSEIPTSSVMIRRSDDALNYDCKTEDGRMAAGAVRSEIEGEKMAASIIFWDLGITDAITDKHRTYQGSVVISVPPKTVATAPATNSSTTGSGGTTPTTNREQLRQIQESMACNEGAKIVSKTSESVKWELNCGDGETLEVRCIDDECYLR